MGDSSNRGAAPPGIPFGLREPDELLDQTLTQPAAAMVCQEYSTGTETLRTAYHEAGHAVVGASFRHTPLLLWTKRTRGRVEWERAHWSEVHAIPTSMAGRLAARTLVFDDRSHQDLVVARMVLADRARAAVDGGGHDIATEMSLLSHWPRKARREFLRETAELVLTHWRVIEAVAGELHAKRQLTGEEFLKIPEIQEAFP